MTESIEDANDRQTVRDCVQLISEGVLTSEDLVNNHLSVVDETDSSIHAWAHLDHQHALEQARALDSIRDNGEPKGSLHGIPVGVKDIFDTSDMPTQRGTPIFSGRQTNKDSAVVEHLREQGAVVMGKTVSTELAFMHPSETRHPLNTNHSPGGSSSGSAAAVAAGQVPLAIGSQTNGSVVRPASYCGVYGFKPSRGIVSRRGALQTSKTLDHVGVFGRNVGDVALLADAISGYDPLDSESFQGSLPKMLDGYLTDASVDPTLVWIDMPYADRYTQDATNGFEELLSVLGNRVDRIPAPDSFSALIPAHKLIHEYEILRCIETECADHWDAISSTIRPTLEAARLHSDEAYEEALEVRRVADDWFKQFYRDYDAILTPSSVGEAPRFEEGTGDPICCTIWTLCGLPCLNLPLLTGSQDLPMGVQLVGALHQDDHLFRTARHFLRELQDRVAE